VQLLHFWPTEDRAVAIDNEIACAHGRLIPWQLAMVRPPISLVWRVSARAASIFAWLVCARDKLYDVFFWRVCEVVDPCVPSIGRAGQARKNWALPPICRSLDLGAADRVLSPSCGHKALLAKSQAGAGTFALNPRKIECPNSPVNFAFPYC